MSFDTVLVVREETCGGFELACNDDTGGAQSSVTLGLAAGQEPSWPSKYDMYYNIIDVRDLVKAHRLAAELDIDHKTTHGGNRYIMHGSGGRSALRFGTEVAEVIHALYPRFVLGEPATVTSEGKEIQIETRALNDCKKAKEVLGVTIRPVEETIRDVVESSIELGIIQPELAAG